MRSPSSLLSASLRLFERAFDVAADVGGDLFAVLLERLLGLSRPGSRPGSSGRSPRGASCPRRRAPRRRASSSRSLPCDRPPAFWTVILFSLPVPWSLAATVRMPLTSMLNVTSICGMPRGAGGMPSRLNVPSRRLSLANSRSPCRTLIVTAFWLSRGGARRLPSCSSGSSCCAG